MEIINFLFWALFVLLLRFSISAVLLILSSAGVNLFDLAQTCIPLFKDLVLSICAIVTAYYGARGLNTWRKQMIGETEFDLAKRFKSSLYKMREYYIQARNPDTTLLLFSTMFFNATDRTKKVVLERFSKNLSVWEVEYNLQITPFITQINDFRQLLPEVASIFGPELMSLGKILVTENNNLDLHYSTLKTFIHNPDLLSASNLFHLENAIEYLVSFYESSNLESDQFLNLSTDLIRHFDQYTKLNKKK